jgi:hypothetical protein
LQSPRVEALAKGEVLNADKSVGAISIPAEWTTLIRNDIAQARDEQVRVRTEFQKAFAEGLVCAGFERGSKESSYLLYRPEEVCL